MYRAAVPMFFFGVCFTRPMARSIAGHRDDLATRVGKIDGQFRK